MPQLLNRDQFIQAYKTAPRIVREAMGSDATIQVIKSVQSSYNLHVDVTGKIAEDLGFMLLGLVDPATFYQGLLDLGIGANDATGIVKKVNEEIFQPLQKRIREGADTLNTPEEDEPEAEYDPSFNIAPTPPQAPPTQTSVPPAPQVPVLSVEARQEIKPIPVPPPAYNLINREIPSIVSNPPAMEFPAIRTMSSDMAAIQHPMQTTPARSFQTSSVPFTSPPPVQYPVFSTPEIKPIITESKPLEERPLRPVQADTPYQTDPYRNTI